MYFYFIYFFNLPFTVMAVVKETFFSLQRLFFLMSKIVKIQNINRCEV